MFNLLRHVQKLRNSPGARDRCTTTNDKTMFLVPRPEALYDTGSTSEENKKDNCGKILYPRVLCEHRDTYDLQCAGFRAPGFCRDFFYSQGHWYKMYHDRRSTFISRFQTSLIPPGTTSHTHESESRSPSFK